MYGNMHLTNDIFIQSFNQFAERIEYAGESGIVAVFSEESERRWRLTHLNLT